MKNIFRLLGLMLALLVAGCATQSTDITAQFKGQSAKQIYTNGERLLAKGRYQQASTNFEALLALYPFGRYAQQSQLNLIYAYYKDDEIASGLAASSQFIHLYPRSPDVDYAYYMRGLINFQSDQNWLEKRFNIDPAQRDLSHFRQAFADFNRLLQLFPNSTYAPNARLRMIYIRNILARHELEVAKFYYRHHAYLASANRASQVVLHYQGSPEVKPALALMVKSYQNLNVPQLANDALRVLKNNYPDYQPKKI